MTDDTHAVWCDDCNTAVRLERSPDNQLRLSCACPETIPCKVSTALPWRWSG